MRRSLILPLSGALVLGCQGGEAVGDSEGSDALGVPVFEVEAPALVIGRMEGDDDYLFQSIQGILQLADGRVAVADAGGSRISLYSEDGVFQRAFGREGGGPGEFGALARIYPAGPDSLWALDGRRARLSAFGLDGGYSHQVDAARVSGDSVYRADVWPHGRFLVTGALTPPDRAAARSAVDALPDPYGTTVARVAWWTGVNELWIREEFGGADPSLWLAVDGSGDPRRWVRLPAGFQPMHLDGDRVLGRMVGELDVESVHVYALLPSSGRAPVPRWISDPRAIPDSLSLDREGLMSQIRASIKYLASAQEIHYSTEFTYADDLLALGVPEMELPEGLEIQILSAGTRGWAMMAAHPSSRVICTLGYGYDTPPGWPGGVVACGN